MAIVFACPVCSKRMSVPDEHAGKIGKCSCGASVRIPAAAAPVHDGVLVPIEADLSRSCELCGGRLVDATSKLCAQCRQGFQAASPASPRPQQVQYIQPPPQQGEGISGVRIAGCLGLIFFLVFGFLVPYAWIGCIVCLVMCLKQDTKPPPPPTIIYIQGPPTHTGQGG